MSFPAYGSYKESGVEWLGSVPARWDLRRIRNVARLNPSKSEANAVGSDTELSFLPMEAIGECGELDLSRTRPLGEVQQGYSFFADGDVVFAKVTPCFENGKGAVMRDLTLGLGFGTTELTVVRPNDSAAAPFLWWFTYSRAFREPASAEMVGAGGLKRVPDDYVGDCVIPWPPLDEQRAIAAFLDQETAKIDALVEAQRRLIELLKEKRQAVISHAATKGLDPAAPMKDSGVEWLGQVPAHWELLQLKHVTETCCDGPFGSGLKSEHYVEEGVRVVRLQNIKGNGFDGTDEAFIDPTYFESDLARHAVQADDLLIAGLGDERNLVGRACVAPTSVEPAMVKADCFRFRLFSDRANPQFIATQLSAGASFDAGRLSSGSTRSRIPLSTMATRAIALPPLVEQRGIASYIAARAAAFDALMDQAGKAITLLQERRAVLISAAVTGKIDVRGLAALAQEADAA